MKDDGSRTQAGGNEQRQHVRERIVERWADHPRRQLLLDVPLTGGVRQTLRSAEKASVQTRKTSRQQDGMACRACRLWFQKA